MKEFIHVFRMGRGFVFRLSLPGCRFVSAEVFETEADAAFAADCFKLHLVTTYRLKGTTMTRSLPPKAFNNFLAFNGATLETVASILPASCKEYLANGGNETLTAFADAWAGVKSRRF